MDTSKKATPGLHNACQDKTTEHTWHMCHNCMLSHLEQCSRAPRGQVLAVGLHSWATDSWKILHSYETVLIKLLNGRGKFACVFLVMGK